MNLDNFVVRRHRRLVEKYVKKEAWHVLATDAVGELSQQVAGLPTEFDLTSRTRFDLPALHLRRSCLRAEPGFERLRNPVKEIGALPEEKEAIPLVRDQMPLIRAVQTDEWWQDVTVPLLEVMHWRLRGFMQLIEKHRRKIIYTDFEDEYGDDTHRIAGICGRRRSILTPREGTDVPASASRSCRGQKTAHQPTVDRKRRA